jgi:hypothetical protein
LRRHLAIVLALGLSACAASAGVALAAGSSRNLPTPDPTARNLTPAEIAQRALDACVKVQAHVQNASEASVRKPCACYARLTVKEMTPDEIDAFRSTGYFNDTARRKALSALDACKLPRPPMG